MHILNCTTVCWADKTNKALFLLLFFALSFSSCEKKENSIGADFVGQRNPFEVAYHDTTTIVAYTTTHDSIPTTRLSYYMLGDLNDPELGQTKCHIITQYALPYDQFDFGGTPQIDSIVLQLTFATPTSYYGMLNIPQKINVYELTEDLSESSDSFYFSNRNYGFSQNLIGQYNKTFENIDDSVTINSGTISTTLPPHLRIRLDEYSPVLKDRFMDPNANGSGYFLNNTNFKNAFKGLAIVASGTMGESELPVGMGCITYINFRTANTALVIYYNDSLRAEFPLYKNSVHANKFYHRYNSSISIQPAFSANHYDQNYLQPATGLKTRITFPHLFDYVKDHKIAVTGAELIFTVQSGSTSTLHSLPTNLRLLSSDSLGRNDFIMDQFIAPEYYGGYLEAGTTYRFNVARQIQHIINEYQNNNRNLNYGLNLLVPGDNPVTAQRVILDTKRGLGSFKLNLTYTVIK